MAPTKVPKKPLKSMEKPVEKPISKTKKMKKKKNYQSFSRYTYKLLRSVTQETNNGVGISRKGMAIMDDFIIDMLEKIATEAGRLVVHSKKTTMGSQDIQSAVRLLLPGELAKHATMEGIKAINMYHTNQNRDK